MKMKLLLVFTLTSWLCQTESSQSTPNFIVFLADSLGYGDLGYNGHPTIQTPNIDQLSFDGMILSQCYSGSPYLSSSKATILTGRIAVRYGLMGGWDGNGSPQQSFTNTAIGGLPNSEITFAQILQKLGYKTMMIGTWDLGQRHKYLPTQFGFDHYFGVTSFNHNHSDHKQLPFALLNDNNIIEQPVNLSILSQRYTQRAIEFISKAKQHHDPYLLFFAFNPFYAQFINQQFCNTTPRGMYGDAIAEMDNMIGDIMNIASDNTLTFFTSTTGPDADNGPNGLFKGG